jgi:hypothetical protein
MFVLLDDTPEEVLDCKVAESKKTSRKAECFVVTAHVQ